MSCLPPRRERLWIEVPKIRESFHTFLHRLTFVVFSGERNIAKMHVESIVYARCRHGEIDRRSGLIASPPDHIVDAQG